MSTNNQQIHRLLDEELSAEEQERLLGEIADDPALSSEYEALRRTAGLLAKEGRVMPPPGFTAAVVARIPRRREGAANRIRGVLSGRWTARWRTAAAVAVLVLAAAAALLLYRPGTITVRLVLQAPQAQHVAVAGDFNKWDTRSHVMTRKGGAWTIDVPMAPGVHTYMFVVDNEHWTTDPRAEAYRDDGYGNRNAVVRVAI